MSARLPSRLASLVSLAALVAACTEVHESDARDAAPDVPPCDGVRTGRYDLDVIPLNYSTINLGPRIELRTDGSFVGHAALGSSRPPRCEGNLTADEARDLADVLTSERTLCAEDTTRDDSSDPSRFDVRIRLYDAAGAVAACNAFRHASSFPATPFHAAISAVGRVMRRVHDEGGCTGPPYEYPSWSGPPWPPPRGVECP